MISHQILSFKERLMSDEEYLKIRRNFYENYEWIESFWNQKFPNDKFDGFCRSLGSFFWEIDTINTKAKELTKKRTVGNNMNVDYNPSQNVINATAYLKCNLDLGEDEIEITEEDRENARRWSDDRHSKFHALMTIIRQIRNNLFHGSKIDLESRQYQRNKELIQISVIITKLILESLTSAEETLR